jgi:hypothetical protein
MDFNFQASCCDGKARIERAPRRVGEGREKHFRPRLLFALHDDPAACTGMQPIENIARIESWDMAATIPCDVGRVKHIRDHAAPA